MARDIEAREEHKANGEVFGFFPDEGKGVLGTTRHGTYDGDSRHTISPLLAYRWTSSPL